MLLFAFLLLLCVLASGDLQLYNNCNNTIYSWTFGPVGQLRSGTIQAQTWHSEPYYQYPWNGSGISIKLAAVDAVTGPITQLEYSFRDNIITYDLSNVNCGPTSQTDTSDCPFLYGGMYLTSNDLSCCSVSCSSGDEHCPEVFNLPTDTWAIHACEYNYQNLILYMCQDGGSC